MPQKKQGDQGNERERDSQGQFESGGSGGGGGGNQGGQGGGSSSGGSRQEAARKGGKAVSEDREHMSEIGRKGGEN